MEIIGVAMGIGGIGNMGVSITVSEGLNLKGDHRDSYRDRWNW